jgi:hypothetical protein
VQTDFLLSFTGSIKWVSFQGVKRPGRGVNHPPPSSARVKEIVELYFYSPSGPSWSVLGRPLPLRSLKFKVRENGVMRHRNEIKEKKSKWRIEKTVLRGVITFRLQRILQIYQIKETDMVRHAEGMDNIRNTKFRWKT